MTSPVLIQADVQAIETVVAGYFDSFSRQDYAQLESLIHPDLAKRHLNSNAEGQKSLYHMSAVKLIESSRTYGSGEPALSDITVLDVYGDIATAKGVSGHFVDYVHLAKLEGRWLIVNVLWAMHEEN